LAWIEDGIFDWGKQQEMILEAKEDDNSDALSKSKP